MPGPSVAVTGATGFIGRTLLQCLTEAGWQVRALTRRARADDGAVRWIHGDLDNQDALQNLVKGVSAVVHCAGQVRGSSFQDFSHTNVDGTARLLHAASQQIPAPRFLLISSLAARESGLSWYATSKYMAEQLTEEYADTLACAIFRPTAVYGPGDKEMSPLFDVARRGILPMAGPPTMRFGLLHVSDLVTAILCWLSAATPVRGVYELDDGTPGGYDGRTVAAIIQDVWKRPVHCVFLPTALVSLVARVNLWLARLLHYPPMLTPQKLRELQHPDWVCDITPLMKALPAWSPQVRLRDALLQTA